MKHDPGELLKHTPDRTADNASDRTAEVILKVLLKGLLKESPEATVTAILNLLFWLLLY